MHYDRLNPKRMLVFLAHPDDGCSALSETMTKYARQGVQVILLCATRGEACLARVAPEDAGDNRERELRQIAEQLGIEVYFLGYPDGGLSTIEPGMLLETITCWIDMVKPQLMITFGPEDASKHPDHAVISTIVTQAYDQCCPKGLLLYTQPSDSTNSNKLFTIARGTKTTDNYPYWFETEFEEKQITH